MRQRIIEGDKFEKHEKPFMRRCITKDIQEWLDKKYNESQTQHMEDVKSSIYGNIKNKIKDKKRME